MNRRTALGCIAGAAAIPVVGLPGTVEAPLRGQAFAGWHADEVSEWIPKLYQTAAVDVMKPCRMVSAFRLVDCSVVAVPTR